MQGTLVWSLVKKLRSHMSQGSEDHLLQLLSPSSTTRASSCCNKRPSMMQERKIPCTATKTRHSQIKNKKKLYEGTSLVVQWLRIRLPTQGTQVQSLVYKDSTCCGGTKPLCHNYWARVPATEPTHARAWAPQDKPPQWEAHTPHLESSPHSLPVEKPHLQQQRLNAAKNTFKKSYTVFKKKKKKLREKL